MKKIFIILLSFVIVFCAGACVSVHKSELDKTDKPIVTPTPTPTLEPKPTPKVKKTEEPTNRWKSLGNFKLYAYCPCESCSEGYGHSTASGARATEGCTIAVDPKVIPYGTKVKINGHVYVAEDCGAAIKNKKIDIFFENHKDTVKFGVQKAEIFILVED